MTAADDHVTPRCPGCRRPLLHGAKTMSRAEWSKMPILFACAGCGLTDISAADALADPPPHKQNGGVT